MAGLLDFLGSDEAKLGLGLLAAGGPSATPLDTWQRVQGAMQGMEADKANKLRLGLLQSQVDENKQQTLLRQQQMALAQRKFALDEQFMGGGLLGPAPSGGVGGASSGAVPAMPSGGAGSAPAGGFNAQSISQQFGIPIEAVIADYRFNDGKKIAELIAKKAEPNWVNVGGNLVNTNAQGFKGGIQDQVNISNDGRATVLRANGGNPVVGAPAGALDTYAAYQGIGARASADYTPEKVIDPATGQTVVRPRSQVLQGAPGPAGYATEAQMKVTAGGDMGANPDAIRRELKSVDNDLMKPMDEGSRTALKEYKARLQQQAANIGVKPMAGNVVELSPAETAANKNREVFGTEAAKADAGQLEKWRSSAEAGNSMLNTAKNLRSAIDQGVYSGGGAQAKTAAASLVAGITGAKTKNLPGSELFNAEASKLVLDSIKTLGANPSNSDRDFIERTIPTLDRSPEARDQLIKFIEKKGRDAVTLHQRADEYARKNSSLSGFKPFEEQPPPASDAAAAPKALKDYGYNDQSSAIRDAQNAIMKGAPRAKVEARLKELGLSLPSGAGGSW